MSRFFHVHHDGKICHWYPEHNQWRDDDKLLPCTDPDNSGAVLSEWLKEE